jgi:hypothetical protein
MAGGHIDPFQPLKGLVYTPQFIRQNPDYNYGDVITHESFNELMRLNIEQGDYNSEVLRIMNTETDPDKTYHVRYLDNRLNAEIGSVHALITRLNGDVNDAVDLVEQTKQEMSGFTQDIQDIINGVTHVHQAEYANNLTGAATAGLHKYYGTDYNGNVGYHDVPDNISARAMSADDALVEGIYFKPRPNSVEEYMLQDEVRLKLNREAIVDYEYLENIPSINSVMLKGNVSLGALGIQPAGNYLTELPENLATTDFVNSALAQYLLQTTASSTYATKQEQELIHEELNLAIQALNLNVSTTYPRVYINTNPSSPKNGDIKVTV